MTQFRIQIEWRGTNIQVQIAAYSGADAARAAQAMYPGSRVVSTTQVR